VIGLAAVCRWKDPESLWVLSRIDELWQIEQWGEDDEATAASTLKQTAFMDAIRFFESATNPA
jgi:chaperone required for assembly of F1-ATPase